MLSLITAPVIIGAIFLASILVFNVLNQRNPVSWIILVIWSTTISYFTTKASIISGTILFGFALHFPVVFFAGLCFLMIKE